MFAKSPNQNHHSSPVASLGRVPRPATSRKAPVVKHTVARLRAQGRNKSEIAREVGIDRETVTRILNSSEIREIVEVAQSIIAESLPQIAAMVTQDVLRERDRALGERILEKSGVLGENVAPRVEFHDNTLQVAIQTLLAPSAPCIIGGNRLSETPKESANVTQAVL